MWGKGSLLAHYQLILEIFFSILAYRPNVAVTLKFISVDREKQEKDNKEGELEQESMEKKRKNYNVKSYFQERRKTYDHANLLTRLKVLHNFEQSLSLFGCSVVKVHCWDPF